MFLMGNTVKSQCHNACSVVIRRPGAVGRGHSFGSVPGSRTRSGGEGGREGRGLSNCGGCEELWGGVRISIRSEGKHKASEGAHRSRRQLVKVCCVDFKIQHRHSRLFVYS